MAAGSFSVPWQGRHKPAKNVKVAARLGERQIKVGSHSSSAHIPPSAGPGPPRFAHLTAKSTPYCLGLAAVGLTMLHLLLLSGLFLAGACAPRQTNLEGERPPESAVVTLNGRYVAAACPLGAAVGS